MVDKAATLRRGIHISLSTSLLYYLVPDPLPGLGVSKPLAALALAAAVTAAEAWRLRTGWTFFLFRDYELHRPAAYYQLGLGCCLALVFFPARFAVLTVLGVCLVDPVIGVVRGSRLKPWASAIGFALWLALAAALVSALGLPVPLWLLPPAAAVAVVLEATRLPVLDDDLTMNVGPLLALTAIAGLLQL